MKMRLSIYTFILLSVGVTGAAAENLQTGLADLSIVDTEVNRPLQGYLWYPTQQSDGQDFEHGNAVWEPIEVIRGASPMQGQYPLVVLSHGMFGNSRNQAWLAKALTKEGYIVAAIDHPGTSTFQRDPDHRRELWERPHDITRTIDHIIDMPVFGGLIDQDRIFMAGHSLGGFTAIALAGGRYDTAKLDAFCAQNPDDLVCGIFEDWGVGKTPEDREIISKDWSDQRIKGFAVFDLGGTQAFSTESLGAVDRPMLVYGAPRDVHGMDLDVESRALAAALPQDNLRYLEPLALSHFDFLGVCTDQALDILKKEEPDDMFVCLDGSDERRSKHADVAEEVVRFFSDL